MPPAVLKNMSFGMTCIKNGAITYQSDDVEKVVGCYAQDLHHHYIEKYTSIKTIRRNQRYTHLEVTVYYVDDFKIVYTLPANF